MFLIPVMFSLGVPTELLWGCTTEGRRKNYFRTFYIPAALRRKEVGCIRTSAWNACNRPLEFLRKIFCYMGYCVIMEILYPDMQKWLWHMLYFPYIGKIVTEQNFLLSLTYK